MEAPLAVAVTMLVLAPLAVAPDHEEPSWWIVEYGGPIPLSEQAFLRAQAFAVLDFAPPFGYLALLSSDARAALVDRSAVVRIDVLAPAAKASNDLPGALRVRALVFPDVDLHVLAAHLLAHGTRSVKVTLAPEPVLDIELGALDVGHLLAHPEALWAEPARDRAGLDNARASSLVQSGANAMWPIHERGVNGSSQIAAYCDTGLDTDAPQALLVGRTVHEMFADPFAPLVQSVPSLPHRKVALYYAPIDAGGVRGDFDDAQGHGTHVAGTLAGDAGAWGARDGNDGVAFAAKLAVCDATRGAAFQVLTNYSAYWDPAYEVGARVHANSWGTAPSNEYTLAARQHDAYAWAHRDFLVFRSMGNSGPDGPMRPEAAAKNVLAIGATTSDATAEAVAEFSARGPASDGRIKPDLVAPGSCVTSADIGGATSYACLSGTSQSTPVAAGAATLVRDYFAKGFYPTGMANPADARDPSSALVRAVMIASAARIASPVPDGVEGWGRPQLENALSFDGGAALNLRLHDEEIALETAGVWTTTLDVTGGSALRIVLVWTDHPAMPGASTALVNDLDLEVVDPAGATVLGNADLGAPDRANVIERVILDAAAGGEYTIRVRGWNVPMGPQPFALVAIGE